MKSMTDFIMEQEQPLYVEEAFDEAELVSSYMSLCAASANMMYMCECVTIVEFCESNDIPLPEKLIQEGWLADKFSKIWAKISEIFAKIAEWFKGLVKGTATAFAKTKITEIIAKLRTYDGETEVKNDKAESLRFLGMMYLYILNVLEKFREAVLTPVAVLSTQGNTIDENSDSKSAKHEYLANIDNLTADLEFLSSTSKWKDANGNYIKDFHKNLKHLSMTEIDKNNNSVTVIYESDEPVTFKEVIYVLEKINRIDIPTKSGKLLKEIQKDEDAIKKYKPNTETISAGKSYYDIKQDLLKNDDNKKKDDDGNVTNALADAILKQLDAAKYKHIDSSSGDESVTTGAGKIHYNDTLKDDLTINLTKGTWVADSDTQKKVKIAADKLAKVYDNVMKAVVDVAELATKDIKKAEGEDKAYNKALERANKESNSAAISDRSELLKDR